MPRFVAKKKTVDIRNVRNETKVIDLLDTTRRLYLKKVVCLCPCKIKLGEKTFDNASLIKATDIFTKEDLIADPGEAPTEAASANGAMPEFVGRSSTLMFTNVTSTEVFPQNLPTVAMYCEFHYVVDTKSRKKEATTKVDTKEAEKLDKSGEKWAEKQIQLANKIWDDVNECFESDNFARLTTQEQLKYFQSRYLNFNKQHPLPLRYMIEARQYKTEAFRRYINKVCKSKIGAQEVFLERQADYVVMLWKELTPKYDTKKAKELWEYTFETIKKETDLFKDIQESANEIASKIDSETFHKYKEDLYTQIDDLTKRTDFKRVITGSERRIAEMVRKLQNDEDSSADELPDFGKIISESAVNDKW